MVSNYGVQKNPWSCLFNLTALALVQASSAGISDDGLWEPRL